jgi:quercetin dioxygenase-like cupin family protein
MPKTPLDRFLKMCADELGRRAELAVEKHDVLAAGSYAFQAALAVSQPRSHELTCVPAAQHFGDISRSRLGDAALAAANEITWVESPRLEDGGTEAALAPMNLVRDLGTLTCGLMLLAPAGAYPEHSHPPQEIYLPIAGDGQWRYGGMEHYQQLGDDTLVYNHPGDRHGAVAGDEPLLALYILWP